MAMKILATSDLHLGRSSSEIPVTERESSTRYTWQRIVDGCIKHSVEVLLLAGDIVDQDNRFFEAIGPLQAGLERLDQEGITVLLVAGNHDHDVLPSIAGNKTFKNIHVLGQNGEWETLSISRNGTTVHFTGWSFPRQFVTESPLLSFPAGDTDPNYTTIGVFHGDAFSREKKYGPFDINNLMNKGVDAWIIGHIHKPQILNRLDPLICYPGSPHSLSPKETGIHAPVLLTVDGRHNIEIKSFLYSPVRYETISVNVSGAKDEDLFRNIITSQIRKHNREILAELYDVRYLVYDIRLTGNHTDVSLIDRWAENITEYRPETESGTIVIPRKVTNETLPSVQNLHELANQSSPLGIIAGTILALQEGRSTGLIENLRKQWQNEYEKIINSSTYQALSTDILVDSADQYILRECNRLMNEFVKQQANG